ncbi:ABC transporter G family member 39-like isoform X1 [Spinacia oleracea]|uniref:ABC transporter G family member 39-like isoform X1 n=2 Tax=Spinacia oleracea TaxID=3562 RepID=A0ABM3RC82_SPIOL|nr:ABC transporter G family member 39-like isoform X1 [Spinacia oleracea]
MEGKLKMEEKKMDVHKMGRQEMKTLVDDLLDRDDHQHFLREIRNRFDRVGVEMPKIEVRFEHLSVKGDVHVGSRALPTLLNVTINFFEAILGFIRLAPSKKRTLDILHQVSGIIKPSRMTLLLGPPSSGKTTLLLALAGKLDNNLKVSGKITYCGHELKEFVPKRTSAYIRQNDIHLGEITVRETLDFSGRCLGVGSRYLLLKEVLKQEKQAGINPDVELDTFMKAATIEGQESNLITDYVLKILALSMCADTIVGDDMRRGISGGEKKRTTIELYFDPYLLGEMLVGPAKVVLMDEISTGLDSATAFQVCKYIKEMTHFMEMTTIISLLQPTPETYDLFDDIILLSEGQIVYQGPRDNVLNFFEYVGFKCPERKGVADFLQEVTSKKDQEQYWSMTKPYQYVSVLEFVEAFWSFQLGNNLVLNLSTPYDKAKTHPVALVKQKYGISNHQLLKACFSREWLLMKRNSFLYIFKSVQITVMSIATMSAYFRTTMQHETEADGEKYLGAIFFGLTNFVFNGMAETTLTVMGLPIFYKQRDFLFYPAWAYALPVWILRIPISFMESALWTILTYYTIGFAPAPSRFFCQWLAYFCIHQMALSFFRLVGAVGRTIVIANAASMVLMLIVFVLGGFIIAKGDVGPWMIWAYYLSPMMYGQHALVINEFLDKRWSNPNLDSRIKEQTIGKVILESRGFFKHEYWFWISIGALLGFSLLFNILYIMALTYLNPYNDAKAVVQDEDEKKKKRKISLREELNNNNIEMDARSTSKSNNNNSDRSTLKGGMVLPFQPLSLSFNHINYFVDTPSEMKSLGHEEDRLQLLRDVSGAFRPGILTALVGVTGAGKTTLMDVLAGRKTSGYIDGNISVSGYPKNQVTFARISGYCEQIDIHSPYVTVYESLVYSAWLRLSSSIGPNTRKSFIEDVMRLIELEQLKDAIVGLPGINGLSTEQRKRLTIAVELVSNPSIIFMDEPTSGLDARAAAIVMRTVRNTVNTGRTVVCTIHQPSIDIFESFDELLLMKRGGQIIYAGPLGDHSQKLINYFQEIPGIPKIQDGYNPATWMLEITTPQVESHLNVDFAKLYANSELYKRNQEIISNLSSPSISSKDLNFPTKYSQPFIVQFQACFWKQYKSYWQNPSYNAVRFFMTIIMGLLLGVMFWDKGRKLDKLQDLMNLLGILFSAILFLGGSNALNVQVVVASERSVFYREKAAGMYSSLPFALAQLAVESIYIVTINFAYTLLLYSMIGFEWTVVKFFYFYYYIFMCFAYYTVYGMMLVSLTPRPEISAILMTFFVTLWNLFAGFLLPRPQIPIWWRWYYWASPVAWTMYGLVTSQIGDKNTPIEVPGGGSVPLKIYLKEILGYDYDFLPYVAIAHLAWVLLFFFVFAYGIKVLNFQKR